MRERETGRAIRMLGYVVVVAPLAFVRAEANPTRSSPAVSSSTDTQRSAHDEDIARLHHIDGPIRLRGARLSNVSCVPFARNESGIALIGNANQWWEGAKGVYARGNVPREGSVLAFRANTHMRLGHVAVVTRVVSARQLEVDQANWPRGRIERGVSVLDVSERNDWSKVRVQIGHTRTYGSVYPTYGFIY